MVEPRHQDTNTPCLAPPLSSIRSLLRLPRGPSVTLSRAQTPQESSRMPWAGSSSSRGRGRFLSPGWTSHRAVTPEPALQSLPTPKHTGPTEARRPQDQLCAHQNHPTPHGESFSGATFRHLPKSDMSSPGARPTICPCKIKSEGHRYSQQHYL